MVWETNREYSTVQLYLHLEDMALQNLIGFIKKCLRFRNKRNIVGIFMINFLLCQSQLSRKKGSWRHESWSYSLECLTYHELRISSTVPFEIVKVFCSNDIFKLQRYLWVWAVFKSKLVYSSSHIKQLDFLLEPDLLLNQSYLLQCVQKFKIYLKLNSFAAKQISYFVRVFFNVVYRLLD